MELDQNPREESDVLVDAPDQAGRREHLEEPNRESTPSDSSTTTTLKRFATSLFVLAGVATALLAILVAGLLINR